MSLLFFDQQDHAVTLVSDTLVTTDGEPSMFQSKVWPLPHLNMTIAVTGTANVGAAWLNVLITNTLGTDIDDLNRDAPTTLREIYRELTAKHGPIGSSTVFHFGFPQGSDKTVRYTYRSATNFKPERLEGEQDFAYKPAVFSFTPDRVPADRDDAVDLAIRIRAENDRGLAPEPVSIGGELYATRIENRFIQTALWYRFPDYDDMHASMTARLGAWNESPDGTNGGQEMEA